jgi:membrane protein DedA with SNARE-associated domain
MFEGFSLFIGALLDALIGPNLFVPGEPFLIAAGYQLHQGVVTGVFAVLLGGFIGDQASYFIGRKLGMPAQKRLIKWQPKTRRPIARCRHLMFKKGNYVLAFARLLGPVAWVVPFIAGTQKITWQRFTLFSTIGLVLGVTQFVAWGYLLSYGVERFPLIAQVQTFAAEHIPSIIAICVSGAFYFIGRKLRWRFLFTQFTAVFVLSMLYANYAHFFFYADDYQLEANAKTELIAQTEIEPTKVSFKVYPGKSSIFDAQAVNVFYYGENPRNLMRELGWIENKTFSRNDLEFLDYIRLLRDKTPPVSDLYWNDIPQEMAFQLPGNLMKRSHIRWWQAGIDSVNKQKFWVGALSYDDGLQLMPYSGIVTVLHSVDPNVDAERDKFAAQINTQLPSKQVELALLKPPVSLDEEHDYFTDGRVLLVSDW